MTATLTKKPPAPKLMINENTVKVNLATNEGAAAWRALINSMPFFERCMLKTFVETGVPSPLRCGDLSIYFTKCGKEVAFLVHRNAVYGVPEYAIEKFGLEHFDEEYLLTLMSRYQPIGMVVPGHKIRIFVNADEIDERNQQSTYHAWVALANTISVNEHPGGSFNCLSRFYDNDLKTMCSRMRRGKLQVLDFTPEKLIPLTDKEVRQLHDYRAGKAKKMPEPPERGFALVNRGEKFWHRSGNVLLHDFDKGMCILLGQDEGSYFGVELPKVVKKVVQAFELLIPKEAKNHPIVRQGEWFMVPVPDKEVPSLAECAASFCGGSGYSGLYIFLPKETEDSNEHWFEVSDGRVGRDGQIYVKNGHLKHDDHAPLVIPNKHWVTFYKNTAVRSFSVQGVD